MPVIPETQTAAIVDELGSGVKFVDDYPVPKPQQNEVLAKVLYTGVCQSDLHTQRGTASGPDGSPITKVKLPHIGGHEGIGTIIGLGPGCDGDIKLGRFVGIRFGSRVCRRCEFCLAGTEQYCINSTNHLHHEDGSFQEYIVLDAGYLTLLPDDINPAVMGPVLCAGLTSYKAVKNANVQAGDWVVVIGAGGGLGHLAVQYACAQGALVIGVDGGSAKGEFVKSIGAREYVNFEATPNVVERVREMTHGGAKAAIVATANAKAFAQGAGMLKVGGTLSCVGIPPGKSFIETPISTIVIKGLRITGNLVGSLKECLEAVDLVRLGFVKPKVSIRNFTELPAVYAELERGDVAGRIVLKIAKE
ncbi:Alcohol dehydrogenase superfamily zinc-containing [Macrophomina phaseolina MS6]|uniref:Alcohol dehydrogenase superfamily zinc-containing n=1 Tax=Macrophomina phaseolina (strain MS6) TaxID=1126212 RepID=K2R8C6_MACPH|nr:Alcohol dehydrogenase superfamily zinc-containing [Macrophomina phaseolina MS6]